MSGIMRVVMAQKNLGKEAQLTQSKIMKLGAQMKQEAVFAEQLAKASSRAGAAMQQTGRRTNQLGVLMQQSGYQIGDFAIQVQSGTNYMVAFGQQATQLVGTFAMLAKSTKMIALFSGLGIALPILTAIGAYFVRAKESAVDSAQGIENAFSALPDFFDELSISISDSFEVAFDKVEKKYGQLFTRLAQIKLDKTKASLTESFTREIASIESPNLLEKLGAALSPGMVMGSSSAALDAQKAVEKSTEGVYELSKAIAEVEARYIASVNAAASLNDIIDITTKTEAELALISEEAANAFALQAEAAGITAKIQEQVNDSQNTSYKRFDAHTVAYQKHLDKIAQANTSAQQELELLKQKNVLLDLELQYGKDSSFYKQQALIYEQDNLRTKLEAKDVDERIVENIIYHLSIQARLTQEISDSADEAERIAKAFDDAQAAARKIKPDFSGVLDPRGESGSVTEAMRRGYQFPSTTSKSEKTKEPVGKKSELEKLRYQVALETELLGKTEARQKVIQAIGITVDESFPKTAAGLEEQINKNLELARVEQERIDLANTIGSAMEDSLMSMVDGTKSVKDAFRDMARDIVRHLYKVLVIQRAINAIGGMIGGPIGGALSTYGQADGGAWQGGSQIKAYANGGVVGGPTMFPMTGGKTGLMGEAGPEAIMPLKRGANGKLGVQMEGGTGQNVVINQSFNFQANGDDSVKKIIAQAAPQIAQMTKKSMLDDRRRGGTTKAVFG
jgi:hypothetical protein